MTERQSVWVDRFEDLKAKGVDRDAALSVFGLLDSARAFGNRHNAEVARDVLEVVWPESPAATDDEREG